MRWLRSAIAVFLIGSITTLMACTPNDSAREPQDPIPATLNTSSPGIDDAIREVIAEALELNATERDAILLSEPFTTSTILIIQRGSTTGAKARIATGRIMANPERFELQSIGGRCSMRHENTGRVFAFPAADCAPTESASPDHNEAR